MSTSFAVNKNQLRQAWKFYSRVSGGHIYHVYHTTTDKSTIHRSRPERRRRCGNLTVGCLEGTFTTQQQTNQQYTMSRKKTKAWKSHSRVSGGDIYHTTTDKSTIHLVQREDGCVEILQSGVWRGHLPHNNRQINNTPHSEIRQRRGNSIVGCLEETLTTGAAHEALGVVEVPHGLTSFCGPCHSLPTGKALTYKIKTSQYNHKSTLCTDLQNKTLQYNHKSTLPPQVKH
jgi:hypothetical protein